MTDLNALIERLEAATGPDRELDGAIWKVVNPEQWDRDCTFKGKMYAGHIHTAAEKRQHEIRSGALFSPLFSSSIDAAMTLVPQGLLVVYIHQIGDRWHVLLGGVEERPFHPAEADSLPRAISAAALKSRSPQP